MNATITVIVDNIPGMGLGGEWGLSLMVEYGEKKILVDAGGSALFLKNMKALGFRAEDVDYAVLSHAHYDHANGMPIFLKNNSTAKWYVRESTAEDCYFKKFIFRKYIGIPRGMAEAYPDRIEKVSGNYQLADGVFLIPHSTQGLELIGKRETMYRKTLQGWRPDNFSHEQSLVLKTEKGLVIINSCSHGGVANIIREVKEALPGQPIYGFVGGMHLFNKKAAEIRQVAAALDNAEVAHVYTGHCTKERAYGILKEELGDRLTQLKVGLRIEWS